MRMSKEYYIVEIFQSIQGEGFRAGTANVFVRFSFCNLKCNLQEHGFECDTNYSGAIKYSLAELVAKIHEIGGDHMPVIFTGGEPALQVDKELCDALRPRYLAIETNGTHKIPEELDWVSCSPKTAEHTLKIQGAQELRYVLPAGHALPRPTLPHEYLYLSPVFHPNMTIDYQSLAWCTKLVMENSQGVRLSCQMHKLLKLR